MKDKYEDGVYLTHPKFGPKTATRKTVIENGSVVELNGERNFPESFSQHQFFDVNTMVGKYCE